MMIATDMAAIGFCEPCGLVLAGLGAGDCTATGAGWGLGDGEATGWGGGTTSLTVCGFEASGLGFTGSISDIIVLYYKL